MSKHPRLALDAAVKAVLLLRPEDDTARDAIARALRISEAPTVARRESPPPPAVEPERQPPPDGPGERAKSEDAESKTLTPRRGPRRTRLFPLPRRVKPALPSWTNSLAADQPSVTQPVAPPEPLFPRRTARGVLKAMLATLNPDERVDIDKVQELLARAAPIATWPRRLGLNMARGAVLLVDAGPGLESFRADLRALIGNVRTVVGADRLQVQTFAGWPPAVIPFGTTRHGAEGEAVQLPAAGTPVLVVSDFGHNVPRASRNMWLRFAGAIRAAGCEPIGLVPIPPNEWDLDLATAFTLIHWERDTTARAARRARQSPRPPVRGASADALRLQSDQDVATLAAALAPATRIDRALLRAMRRRVLPTSSPAIEARFWQSDMIGSRGELAVTWDATAVGRLRKRLRDENTEENDPRLRLVARVHGTSSALHRREEQLIALDIARPADWEAKVNDLLRQILRKLIDAPKREAVEIARWAFRAMPAIAFDLPENARETARDLLYAAALRVGRLPQAEGPLRAGIDMPAWITAAIIGTGLDQPSATLPVAVRWTGGGLRIGGDARDDGHEIRIPATALPALAVTWEQSGATAPGVDQWVSARGIAAVLPPDGETVPLAAALTAQDGARWRIEDADRADALKPLRILVVMGEKDEQRFRGRFAEWADELRRQTGLHDAVPILMHAVRLSTMPDRSLWRGIQSELVDWASHVIVVLSEAIVSPNWTWDVLRFIDSKVAPDARDGAIIAFTPEASTRIAESERFDALLNEFPWLRRALLEPESPESTSIFSDVSERLLTAWRNGNALHARRFDAAEPRVVQDFARSLQWVALGFHTQAFDPPRVMERARVDRRFYGLDLLPQAGRPVPDVRDGKSDQAEVDFEHVRFQAEYLFGSRVVDYLGGGQDPFAPVMDVAEFQRQARAVIAITSNVTMISPGDRSAQSDEVRNVADALKAFQAFANTGAKERFAKKFGDSDLVARLLFDGIGEPERDALSGSVDALIGQEADFAQLVWPFSAEVYRWRLRFPASFAASHSFPEYLEAMAGLLVHYLRSAAEHSPDTLVECRSPISESAYDLMRSAFVSSFVSSEQVRPPQLRGTPRPPDAVLRLPNFADLTARLCDAVIWGVRAEAERRLARQPDEPTEAEEIDAPAAGVTPLRRVALVVGNAQYENIPALSSPVRDTALVAAVLREAGFVVVHATNLKQSELVERLRAFASAAAQADWALIYFAGHGVAVGKDNYLLPVDAEPAANRITFEGVAVDDVVRAAEGARRLRVVLLDAGSDNGINNLIRGRLIPGESAAVDAEEGIVVIYSAGRGQSAVEFANGSPFASAFVTRMREPGLDIRDLFAKIRDDVSAATRGRQNPSMHASFSGRGQFYLAGRTDIRENAALAPEAVSTSATGTAAGVSSAAAVSETPARQVPKAAKKRAAGKKKVRKKVAKKTAKKAVSLLEKAPLSPKLGRSKVALRRKKKKKKRMK